MTKTPGIVTPETIEIAILLVLVAISPLSSVATPEQSGDAIPGEKTVAAIRGSFTVKNSPPEITDLTVLKNATSPLPRSTYTLKIDVADRNTLRDIHEILVTITLNKTQGNNEKKKAIYRWTPAEGWQLMNAVGRWGIDANESKEPEDLTATAGTWRLCYFPHGNKARGDICVDVSDSQATDSKTLYCEEIRQKTENLLSPISPMFWIAFNDFAEEALFCFHR